MEEAEQSAASPVPVVVEHIASAQDAVQDTAGESVPEQKPVKASVFDDDFFRKSKEDEGHAGVDAGAKQWPDARIPSFAGYAGEGSAPENDELDIPAFLRRKQ